MFPPYCATLGGLEIKYMAQLGSIDKRGWSWCIHSNSSQSLQNPTGPDHKAVTANKVFQSNSRESHAVTDFSFLFFF